MCVKIHKNFRKGGQLVMKRKHMLIVAMAFALLFIAPLTVNAEEESSEEINVTWYQNATGW